MLNEPKNQKPKILFFSDSRGSYKHSSSMRLFWENLEEEYDVVSYAQPYKWTTILDFISLVRDGTIVPSHYEHIILWCGVVDFSPRPSTSCVDDLLNGNNGNQVTVNPNRTSYYNRRINAKMRTIKRLKNNRFLEDGSIEVFDDSDSPVYHEIAYNGEKTASLYSADFLEYIARELNSITNLIFIDTCDIHPAWDGNFLKGRPRNISVLSEYSSRLTEILQVPVVTISDWTNHQLEVFTIDSIHLTQAGSDAILDRLKGTLGSVRQSPRTTKANYILTATDEKFFSSSLQLIESIFETSSGVVDKIFVLDIGLSARQRSLLEAIHDIHVLDYLGEDLPLLKGLPFDFFEPQKYGFKSYLTARAPALIEEATGMKPPFNLMYVDGGIFLNHSIAPIFDKIEMEGIFSVDHEDCHDLYGDNPFFLLNILSPKLFDEGFELLPNSKLTQPYIKAGFFGYKAGGKWQYLIDEYWKLCLTTSVLDQPKPVSDKTERFWFRNNTKVAQYAKENIAEGIPPFCFEYSNGRQDQTALSYLICKYEAPICRSREYNFTVSSNLPKDRIKSVFERLASRYPEISDDFESFWKKSNEAPVRDTTANLLPVPNAARAALSTLHRGALTPSNYVKYSGRLLNRARNIRNDTFILLGNGPSLGDVDLHSLQGRHTMGLNAAYRAYEKIGFWPKYFGCFDALVCGYHSEKFKSLIRDSSIEKFFFINYDESKKQIFPEYDIQQSPKFENINFVERTVEEKGRDDILSVSFDPFIDMLTSGSNSIQTALLLGYRKIILLGCDANYTEVIDGAKQEASNKNRITMERTPETNSNYWFSDYQQEGDRFNLPNTAGCQLPAWGRLSRTMDLLNINAEIINCSPISNIEDFKKMSLEDALAYFDSYDVGQLVEPSSTTKFFHRKARTESSISGEFDTFRERKQSAALMGSEEQCFGAGRELLMTIASELLAKPKSTLPRIENGDLKKSLEQAMSEIPSGDPVKLHYDKVVFFCRRSATMR